MATPQERIAASKARTAAYQKRTAAAQKRTAASKARIAALKSAGNGLMVPRGGSSASTVPSPPATGSGGSGGPAPTPPPATGGSSTTDSGPETVVNPWGRTVQLRPDDEYGGDRLMAEMGITKDSEHYKPAQYRTRNDEFYRRLNAWHQVKNAKQRNAENARLGHGPGVEDRATIQKYQAVLDDPASHQRAHGDNPNYHLIPKPGGGGGTSGSGNGLMVPRLKTSSGAAASDQQLQAMVPDMNGLMQRRKPATTPEFSVRPEATREAAPTVGGVPATAGAVPGVSGRLTTLLDSDSPYLERARTRGLQHANRRGLLNSSIAAGASEAAAIDAALPIAQADANIAANERAMRSQEFQQLRAIRSAELMQQKGLDHDTAMRETDRELSVFLQERDHRVQQLMQTGRLDHDAAQRQATREMQVAMQAASLSHASFEAGQSRDMQQRIAAQSLVQSVNAEINRLTTLLATQTDLPQEVREQYQARLDFMRDETLKAAQIINQYVPDWTSTQRPPDTGEETDEAEAA